MYGLVYEYVNSNDSFHITYNKCKSYFTIKKTWILLVLIYGSFECHSLPNKSIFFYFYQTDDLTWIGKWTVEDQWTQYSCIWYIA